jgi:hypothetical protein
VTEWVETPTGGRERGPVGLARAWVEVLVRPRRFFATKVAPGDQAPGLTFVAVVVLIEEATRLALVEGAAPVIAGQPTASAVLWLLAAVVLVTPAVIHLTAALQTVLLAATAPTRAGVSETVQVLCYATAPAVVAGVPNPWVRAGVALWGGALLVVGTSEVHDVPLAAAVPLALVPAGILFGGGFRGFGALAAVGDQLWDALDSLLG